MYKEQIYYCRGVQSAFQTRKTHRKIQSKLYFDYKGILHNFYNLGKCGGNQEVYTTLKIDI